ncbi:flagellar basal body L-ring protein FlgH [Litoreibacter albidus]|uniref:Flagellar L-ring protein n=1 Tax=Litoreibacter albidus TaxID=670155 RepID=A0A1H2VHX1_9RHOB|nr:flagellar basal body L-ring protein FlgH [Litoreibacter albidus]SDW67810.1 flagellar L-ring protein precursor FlgH [Litoreibacter albidus]
MSQTRAIQGLALFAMLAACGRLEDVGKPPEISAIANTNEHYAMMRVPVPKSSEPELATDSASLWESGRNSLLGNQRAEQVGDIVTVVVEIDERAEISNSSSRGRSGSENLELPSLLGIPQRVNEILPDGASLDTAVSTNSSSSSSGDGTIKRKEKFSIRVAATVVDVLQNGVLSIEGSQEVRVNFELRELLVSGYVRPADINRKNEVSYDRIAAARISYGGRGQITDVQQPRYGQQIADIVLPF